MIDSLALGLNLLDALMKRGKISYDEAWEIIRKSLDNSMSSQEKDELVDRMVLRTPSPKINKSK